MKKIFKMLGLLAFLAASVSMVSCKHSSGPDPVLIPTEEGTDGGGGTGGGDWTDGGGGTGGGGNTDEVEEWLTLSPRDALITLNTADASKDIFIKVVGNPGIETSWAIDDIDGNPNATIKKGIERYNIYGGKISFDFTETSVSGFNLEGACSIKSVAFPNCPSISEDFFAYLPVFQGCTSLENVTLPKNIRYIGDNVFDGCSSLKSLTLPKTLESIGDFAFAGCTSLESIIISNGVTSIGDNAFSGCSSLKSVTLPQTLTSIGFKAFDNCISLESVTLPDGITFIGDHMFDGCTSLKSVTLPQNLTSIGGMAFYNCTSLESITIPCKVEKIEYCAFAGCSSLENVFFDGTREQWSNITKGSAWRTLSAFSFVHCSDGDEPAVDVPVE